MFVSKEHPPILMHKPHPRKELLKYKGYIGSVEFSEEDALFYGKVQGIRSLISYEGTNASELISDFPGAS